METEKLQRGFLYSIHEPELENIIFDSLKNNKLFVAVATGKVGDLDLLSKMYALRELVEQSDHSDAHIVEHYSDDGQEFSSCISFIKKDW